MPTFFFKFTNLIKFYPFSTLLFDFFTKEVFDQIKSHAYTGADSGGGDDVVIVDVFLFEDLDVKGGQFF